MKLSIKYLAICALLLLFCGCPDETIQPSTNPLHLTVEETTCTEAFLRISLAENESSRTVTLKRGDSTIATITIAGKDSLFVDEGLLPKKAYTYTLTAQNFNVTAQATTMDTTSHDWTWQVDTLGIAQSYLYDVAIINDTLAYAVGEIYIKDSTGQFDDDAYNLARWNGKDWKLMRIHFYTICGQQNRTSYPASSIFAFSPTDIWIAASGSQIAHWNGVTEPTITCLPVSFSINKLWGTNSNDVYAVGYNGINGIILHFNGNTWQKIESGTTLDITGIWGSKNTITDQIEILATAAHPFYTNDRKILQISGENVTPLLDSGINYPLSTVWFSAALHYYVAGSGIYEKVRLADNKWSNEPLSITPFYIYSLRGNSVNDVVAVGGYGAVLHFNGVTWESYKQLHLPSGNFESVAIKGNLIIATGWQDARGYIAVGKRK